MEKKVLIITFTKEDNNCVETVSRSIEKFGGKPVYLYVDKYPYEQYLASTYLNGKWEIEFFDGNTQHNLNEFSGIWNRRFSHLGTSLKAVMNPDYLQQCITESNRTLFGVLRHLEQSVFFINDYSALEIAESKELQLRVASDLGIRIPKTCITNHPETARQFLTNCPHGAISKMQHNFRVYKDGDETTLFTNEITENDIERLESLAFCPMQFQEKIEKELELRIILVGQNCYAFSIDSQAHKNGETDWRKIGAQTLDKWQPIEIPALLKEQLIAYMRYFKLNYGAADFILTPTGEYVFLEMNPAGEFFWIDERLNFEISDQMAQLLLNQVERNPSKILSSITAEKQPV